MGREVGGGPWKPWFWGHVDTQCEEQGICVDSAASLDSWPGVHNLTVLQLTLLCASVSLHVQLGGCVCVRCVWCACVPGGVWCVSAVLSLGL